MPIPDISTLEKRRDWAVGHNLVPSVQHDRGLPIRGSDVMYLAIL